MTELHIAHTADVAAAAVARALLGKIPGPENVVFSTATACAFAPSKQAFP